MIQHICSNSALMTPHYLEIHYSGKFYTMEMSKYYKLGLDFLFH